MANITMVIGLHLAACVFLISMIYGVVTDGPIGFIFIQSVVIATIVVLISWLANTFVEAGKMKVEAETGPNRGTNLDIVLPETDTEVSALTVLVADDEAEQEAESVKVTP